MMERKDREASKQDIDNRSRQLNAEHDAYWRSRGGVERPSDRPQPVPPSDPTKA